MAVRQTKTKVMALVPTMRTGGAERVISLLLQHLDRARFEPELAIVYDTDIAYPIPDDVPVHILAHEPQLDGALPAVDLPPALAARFADSAAWLESAAGRLASVVDRRRPDVIISSPLWASILAIVAHDRLPASTRLVNRVDAPPSVSLAQSELQELFTYYMRTRFNLADRVVAVSQAVGRDLVQNFAVDPERIEVLHNPVDIRRIQSLAEEPVSSPVFADDVPVVLFVGRLERVKGLEYLLRAMARVVQVTPARLALVGDGSQGGYLRALSAHLGMTGHVHFLGRQSNPFKYMRRATTFVLPSLSEGMPNVLLEAMTSGCPVIASDIAGGITREVLDEGAYGLIVPREDESALADAILTMLRDAGLRQRFTLAGLERATEFDLPRIMLRNQEVLLGVAEAAADEEPPDDGPGSGRGASGATAASLAAASSAARSSILERMFGGRLAVKAASATAILRRNGWRALGARAVQEVRYALATAMPEAAPAATAREEDRRGEAVSAKTRLMVLVPATDDESTRTGTAVLLRHLDRERFDVSLVRIFAGHPSRTVPRDIAQHVLRPRRGAGVIRRDSLPEGMSDTYRTDLDRIDAAVRGLAHLAGQLGTDAILAEGFYPSILASLATGRLPEDVAVVGVMRSHASNFTAGVPLGDLHGALVRAGFDAADAILAPDENIEADLVGKFGVSAGKVRVIPDPIDARDLTDARRVARLEPASDAAGTPHFISQVMPGAEAEADYLLRAVAAARGRQDLRCTIVGGGEGHAEMKELAVELGIGDAVRFAPGPGVELDTLRSATALVQPAPTGAEGIPGVIVEAMAVGCPVISTRRSDALCDLLGDGEYGVLVAAKDPYALADGMLQVAWDEDLRRDLARKGPARLKGFVAEGIVPRYEQVIAEAACRRRARSAGPDEDVVGTIPA